MNRRRTSPSKPVRLNRSTVELRAQRQWFEVILSGIGDAVITADMKENVNFMNAVAESLTGWSHDAAQGLPLESVFRIVHEQTGASVENPALRALREGAVFGLANHTLLLTKDGRKTSIDGSSAPVRGHEGTCLGAVLIFRDITERRQADESRALLAEIVDSSEDAIISKSLDGIITSWNAAAERLFEYSAVEAVGRSITMIIPPERLGEETHILSRLRAGGRIEHFETVRVTKSGRPVHISLTVSPIRNRDGEIIGASKIARDITGRVRAEEERTQLLASERTAREDAEAASRAKDEFVAIISHEIRSPLNAILGWSQMIRQGALEKDRLNRALENIERNVRAQVQLLGDLLDMSQAIVGKLRINTRPVDVMTCIEAAFDSIRPATEAKSIRIELHRGPGASIVTGDADRLQQVFWNLLSNAVKFTPKHGHIKVAVQRLNSHLDIIVSDSGCGIRKEFLPHIFERFTQDDATSAHRRAGLGLGLAIVRHLVELHGGTVRAESAGEGQGATLTVTLPVRVVREAADDLNALTPGSVQFSAIGNGVALNGVRVMIVDDEPDARELLTTILTSQGAETVAYASAADAIAAINDWKPAVLVSDIGMPDCDGYAFLQQVRSLTSPQRYVPAVALTSYARPEDRLRALAVGFHVHVPKPVEMMELLMVVASLSNRHLFGG